MTVKRFTFRAVLEGGEMREVLVESDDCPKCDDGTCEEGMGWLATAGDEEVYSTVGPRNAAMYACASAGWPVVGLLAPGEPTRAELAAAVRAYLTAQDALDANAANIGAFEDRIVARKALDVIVGVAT